MSYLRDDRYDATLPSIGRSVTRPRSPTIHTLEDHLDHHKYSREKEPLFYTRPMSPVSGSSCRKQVVDMQEQLRIYREELSKKDQLISDMATAETPRPRFQTTTTSIEDIYSNERMASHAAAKSEAAALNVRCDSLTVQCRDMQVQLEARHEQVRELKLHLETSKESEAKYRALHQTLREKLVAYESEHGNLEDAATRSTVAIETYQRQYSDAKARIIELERCNRELKEEAVHLNNHRASWESRLTEIITKFAAAVCLDGSMSSSQPETIIDRITDVMQENALMRGKLATLKEYLSSAETENKASRETIMRLVGETEREQRNSSKYTLEVDNCRLERDQALSKLRDFEHEVGVLRERLDANQRAWDATRSELEDREARDSRFELKVREYELQSRSLEGNLREFKEQLAGMLQVEPYEEKIRERISALMLNSRDKSSHIDLLESKVSQLTQQLEAQLESQRSASMRVRQYEDERSSVDVRLRKLEADLAAGDVLRDGMRTDKERYLRFLEQVSVSMKMDPITADLGIDGASEAILCRAEQLSRLEADALADRKTHIYNLQRKIKSMKEQLESKELHMDLLRKKVASLEERLSGSSELSALKDEEYIKNKKLLKLVDKYKHEIQEYRIEIRDLKARLLEGSDLRNRTMEQNSMIDNLESKVGQLEDVRLAQSAKLSDLKTEIEVSNSRLDEKREVAHNTVHSLSSELRTTKAALDEITQRERQLLDLRQVIARMLGLDVNTLAVPDYEILTRMEKLILANQSNAATVIALDTAMDGISDSFRSGYNEASKALHQATRARSPTRRMHTRARSVSPSRRKDTRSY